MVNWNDPTNKNISDRPDKDLDPNLASYVSFICDMYNDIKPHDYVWCSCCQRTYQAREHTRPNGNHKCPYWECSGNYLDIEKWAYVRQLRPHYPVRPEPDRVYPLNVDPKTQFLV